MYVKIIVFLRPVIFLSLVPILKIICSEMAPEHVSLYMCMCVSV